METLFWNVFFHFMNVSRKERYAYINDLKNSYKVWRDDTGKHKNMMIDITWWNIKYVPIVYGNLEDRLV